MLTYIDYDQISNLLQEDLIICYNEAFIISLIYMLVKFEFYYVRLFLFVQSSCVHFVPFRRSHLCSGIPRKQ